jgi:hypothetical protein
MAFLLGYLGMLRISNVAPVSRQSFDPLRHLIRQDVRLVGNTLLFQLRWIKTLQHYRQHACVRLFQIPGSPVCPVDSFMAMNSSYPDMPSDPFLSYRVSGQICVITQAHLRRALKCVSPYVRFVSNLTYHAFCRSGTSLAFACGVPFQAIQAHGTWASESLWAYIDANARDCAFPWLFASVFSRL